MRAAKVDILRPFTLLIATLLVLASGCGDDKKSTGHDPTDPQVDGFVADHTVISDFGDIATAIKENVADSLNIFYGHTSHGSQLMTGLDLVEAEDATFRQPYVHEYGDDLGADGDTSWVPPTRAWLNDNPDCNVVIWSWCGGVSSNSEEGIATYLAAMSDLEADYPDVVFIYMTGHLDGTGPDGNLYARNNQIRAYCEAHDKWLFDFADIESYDPAGVYYPDASDACEWAADWCLTHTCASCDCAHSECINCYQKGKAFWWLLGRVVEG